MSKHIEKIRQTYRCWNESKDIDHEKINYEREKNRRVKLYRKSMEDHAEIDYVDIDEHSQYNYQMAFAKYCPAIDLEDCDA